MIHCLLDGDELRIFRHGVHRPESDAFALSHDVPSGHYEAVSGWDDGGTWMRLRPIGSREVSRLRMDGRAIGIYIRWRGEAIDLAGVVLDPAQSEQSLFLGAVPDEVFDGGRVFFSVR